MRATPRSQLIGLLALAVAAMGGLILLWAGVPAAGPLGSDQPLGAASEGLSFESSDDLSDALGGPRFDEGALEGGSELSVQQGGRAAMAPDRVAAGASFVEYRATLLVSDGSNGLPVAGATVTEVFFLGEALDPARGWRATEADGEGLLEVVCRLPESPRGKVGGEAGAEAGAGADPEELPELRSFDVRVAAPGYVGAAATGVDARLEAEPAASDAQGMDRDAGPVREVTLYAAGSLVLDVLQVPSTAVGEMALWFQPSARNRSPDLKLSWPVTAAEAKSRGVTVAPSAGGATRLVFSDLPPGPLSVALAVVGSPVAMQQALTLQSGEQLQESLQLAEGEMANGIVRDLERKTPFAGVTVVLSPKVEGLNERLDRLPYPPQVTDERGAFSFSGLPLGDLEIELHTPDGAKHPRKVVILKGNIARRHELNVRGSASLAGKVNVAEGLSFSGLKVLVTTAEDAAGVRAKKKGFSVRDKFGSGVFAEVDLSTGEFVAEAVPSGRQLVVHAIAEGSAYAIARLSALKLGETMEGIEISLEPRPAVRFRVEAANGEAVTAVTVNFKGSIEAGLPGGETRVVSRWSPAEDLELRSDGLFTATPRVTTPEKVRVRWDGRAHDEFDWPGGDLDAIPTFTIVPDPLVLVEVRGSDGVAVPGARIRASVPKSVPSPRKSGKGLTTFADTDDFGRAYLRLPLGDDGTVPSPLDLRVTARGYSSTEGLEVSERDALPGPARVVLLERAEFLEPALITGRLVRGNGEALLAPRFDGLRGGAAHVDGHAFELRGIRPGRVRVIAHCDLFESTSFPKLDLRPGERYDVGEIEMRPATILSVTVKDSKGRTVKDAQVQLLRLPAAKAGRKGLPRRVKFPGKPDSRRTFTRRNIPRAKWRLVVKHRGHVTHDAQLWLAKAKQQVRVRLKAKP